MVEAQPFRRLHCAATTLISSSLPIIYIRNPPQQMCTWIHTTLDTQPLVNRLLHVRALRERVLRNYPRRIQQFPRYEAHPISITLLPGLFSLFHVNGARLPLFETIHNTGDDLMFPQIIDDAVGHCEHHIVFFDFHNIQDGGLRRRVWGVCAELARAVEPVPLLRRLEDDLSALRPQYQDLRVAYLGDVQERVRGRAVGAAEERRARRGGAEPFVGLGCRFFGAFECGLQVGDWVWGRGGAEGCGLDF
jgi:hypothetical protein